MKHIIHGIVAVLVTILLMCWWFGLQILYLALKGRKDRKCTPKDT